MKKIYFLSLLFCMSFAANAQTTTTFYATGITGSYITGSATETIGTSTVYTRSEGTIAATDQTTLIQAGYAVFDISSIPSGASISSVVLGVNVQGFTGVPGVFGECKTYGHPTNLSGVSSALSLLDSCRGITGTLLWDATTGTADGSYGSGGMDDGLGVGDTTMISTLAPSVSPAACNFIYNNRLAGINTISISFSVATGPTSFVYNFEGEPLGAPDTSGLHVPYLIITYCFNPTGVTATASPGTVCVGNTLQLTGTATGASSYQWNGPGGFSSTLLSPTLTVVPASAGTYTFTANTLCGAGIYTQTTTPTPVVVNPSPAAITTATTTVCKGGILVLSDATAGGVWSSSNTSATIVAAATVATVTAVNAGTPIISYTLTTGGCSIVVDLTVNDTPTAITGPSAVCASGGTITLVDGVSGGTWSSSNTTLATVDASGASGGLVTGVAAGSPNISYFTGACPTVTYPITVDPLPTNILGNNVVCVNAALPLSDATASGTWSSSDISVATVDLNSGIVTGVTAGIATITYTLPTSCYITMSVTVNPIPDPIAGLAGVCVGLNVTLSDATSGGTWSSSNTTVATIGSTSGVVSGISANGITITYTLPVTGCFNTLPFTVDPLPNTITGPTPPAVCVQSTVTLNDATSGGNWSSQLTSIATVDPVLGTVTGVSSGISYISYTLSGTACYTSFSVTVNPLPAAVITPVGPTTFCAGGSVVLNCSTAPGNTYQWFSNGTPYTGAGATSSSITVNSSQNITVRITDANGCVNTSAVTQVSLVQTAVIAAGGPVVFCQTGNVLLSVPSAPGILYQWFLNGTAIPGANASTYYATLDGTYTASLNVPGGCAATTPGFAVTVYPLPIPVVTYSGGQLTTTNGYVSYQWFLNSVAITGATTTAVTPAINGNYIVRVIDGNGCVGYSAVSVINTLGVQQINTMDIKIYPNPTNSIVHIESPVSVRALVTDMEGKTLMETVDAKDLNISVFPNGLYMIMLYDDSGNRLVVQKLVKE